jgi:hypothetical protein
MDDLTGLIGQYGFPIVAYLLLFLRLEKKVDKLTDAIVQLASSSVKSGDPARKVV